jgi:hypothetical protein
MVTVLRPLSTSELLDRTFHLYRNHFPVFAGITAIPQLFILAMQLGGAALMMRARGPGAMILIVGGYLLFYLAIFIAQAPTIVAVSNLHMEKPIGIGSALLIGEGEPATSALDCFSDIPDYGRFFFPRQSGGRAPRRRVRSGRTALGKRRGCCGCDGCGCLLGLALVPQLVPGDSRHSA